MQTDELSLLAKDFVRRMSALDWLTDALFLAGMYPSTGPHARPGQRTIEEHVILIGPTADRSRPSGRQPVDLEPPPVVVPGLRRPRDPASDRSAP